MAAYWAKCGGETHYNKWIFDTGAWGDDRLEMDQWLKSKFSPLLYPKDLAKMVRSCSMCFLFFLLTICTLSQVVKKKSDMRTNMSTRLMVAGLKVWGICDTEGKVLHPLYMSISRYLADV